MVGLMRHRQTKGPVSARPYLNRRATPRLHLINPEKGERKAQACEIAFHENAGGCQVDSDFDFSFRLSRAHLSSIAESFCRAARSGQGRAVFWRGEANP